MGSADDDVSVWFCGSSIGQGRTVSFAEAEKLQLAEAVWQKKRR
jgi:hypothetical protein